MWDLLYNPSKKKPVLSDTQPTNRFREQLHSYGPWSQNVTDRYVTVIRNADCHTFLKGLVNRDTSAPGESCSALSGELLTKEFDMGIIETDDYRAQQAWLNCTAESTCQFRSMTH